MESPGASNNKLVRDAGEEKFSDGGWSVDKRRLAVRTDGYGEEGRLGGRERAG